MARIAGLTDFNRDFGLLAMEGVFQRHLHVIAQVSAPARLLPAAAAPECLSENRFEYVADVPETLRTSCATHTLLKRGMAEAVVCGALLRVFQALIGFGNRLELVLVLLATGIAVRMILHRKLAVGGLDRRAIRIPLDAEHLIIIELCCHGVLNLAAAGAD